MSQNEEKQTTAVTQQQQPPEQPITQDRRILLIRSIRKRPRIYKNEFLRTPFLLRHEKQKIWDEIAREARFYKTEDAKCKWRSLINHLRQHLEQVAQKKQRRYIPNTQIPEDRYIQLNDWAYYKELEFVVPYVKYAATKQTRGNRLNPTSNEIDLIIKAIEEDLDSKDDDKREDRKKQMKAEANYSNSSNHIIELDNGEDNLSPEDEMLKEFFENMLKSTLSLPRFHQNRIKNKLMHSVSDQKGK